MRPEKIISYTDLKGKVLNDNRSPDPPLVEYKETSENKEAQIQITTPAQDAAILREASIFKRNDNFLFILPKQYLYDVFEGNGKLDSKGSFIVIIVGPFGSGKNSVTNNAIEKANDHIQQVTEHTSRQRRTGETEGVEYYFKTKDEFQRMAENNELLIWGNLTGNDYGYAVKSIQEALDNGKIPILIQGPNNAGATKNALEKRNIPIIVAFISPLSQEELNGNGGIDKAIEILEKRMEGTERNRLKERSLISRAMFESLPQDIALIENSNGNLEQATINLLNLIQAKKDEINPPKKEIPTEDPATAQFEKSGFIDDEFFKLHNLKSNGNIAIIISGPSGVGKGTILTEAFKDSSLKLTKSLSSTSRNPRPNEKEDVDYNFTKKEEFQKKIENNEFLQWVCGINQNYYGQNEKRIQGIFDNGNNPLFDVDIKGSDFFRYVLKRFGIPVIDIFISPVPKEILKNPYGIEIAKTILRERLMNRGSGETPAQIEDRVNKAEEYLKAAHTFSYIIENTEGGLENATREFIDIIKKKI